MTSGVVVGVRPWLPRSLSGWTWMTEPVRAERLAAFRIGLALVLLLDIVGTYWPHRHDYYGHHGLTAGNVFAGRFASPHWNWSILNWAPDQEFAAEVALVVWAVAAIALLVGLVPQAAAAVCWALSVSFFNSNYYLHNAGDRLRSMALLLLALAPSAAAWSVTSWRRADKRPAFVYPWVIRLLFLELVLVYFFNGVYKLSGAEWRDGTVLHYVLSDAGWARWYFPTPLWFDRCGAWLTVAWELAFPALVLFRPTRVPALWIGVLFHIYTGLNLEISLFPLYALCFYLPLVPWESITSPAPPSRARPSPSRP